MDDTRATPADDSAAIATTCDECEALVHYAADHGPGCSNAPTYDSEETSDDEMTATPVTFDADD